MLYDAAMLDKGNGGPRPVGIFWKMVYLRKMYCSILRSTFTISQW
jgi:hypothetical protein